MGFSIICEKKGCGKSIEPLLDPETNKVYCPCDDMCEITQLTDFAKRQMVSLGQLKNKTKERKAFSIKCPGCLREATPKLKTDIRDEKGLLQPSQLHCPYCDAQHVHLSPPFAQVLKENLAAQKKAGS